MNKSIEMDIAWDEWYEQLQTLASRHAVSVGDKDAWRECFDDEMSPEEAFYEEHPALRPRAETKASKKQHTKPCRACPWRKASAPGWLGASEPGEFLAQSDSGIRMPCHLHVDYEKSDWKEQVKHAPQCAGRAIFQANRCQLPEPGNLKLPPDREAVFTWPHEFVAHHAGVSEESLKGTLVYSLYKIKRS